MAEGLTRFFLFEAGLGDRWSVSSSGLAAFPGDPVAPHALKALAEMGVDLSGHRSSRTSPYAVEKARYVFAMTGGHRDHLLRLLPDFEDRIFLFSDFARREQGLSEALAPHWVSHLAGPDIPDPYGLDLGHYRNVAQTLAAYSRLLVLFLRTSGPDLSELVSD